VVIAFPESPVAVALKDVAEKVAARISVLAVQGAAADPKPENIIP
jgi:hypothetical protein